MPSGLQLRAERDARRASIHVLRSSISASAPRNGITTQFGRFGQLIGDLVESLLQLPQDGVLCPALRQRAHRLALEIDDYSVLAGDQHLPQMEVAIMSRLGEAGGLGSSSSMRSAATLRLAQCEQTIGKPPSGLVQLCSRVAASPSSAR